MIFYDFSPTCLNAFETRYFVCYSGIVYTRKRAFRQTVKNGFAQSPHPKKPAKLDMSATPKTVKGTKA